MLKETETEETKSFFVTFLSLVAILVVFFLGGGGGGPMGLRLWGKCVRTSELCCRPGCGMHLLKVSQVYCEDFTNNSMSTANTFQLRRITTSSNVNSMYLQKLCPGNKSNGGNIL